MNADVLKYLVSDELPRVRPCLVAAVDHAEARGVTYYGLLSPHFYYVIRDRQISSCIDKSAFTATRVMIRNVLGRMRVVEPREEYRCL
jgi:hypothetical protein